MVWADNYRHISLTTIVCKLMERLIKPAIMDHLDHSQMFSFAKHGFVKGTSCLINWLATLWFGLTLPAWSKIGGNILSGYKEGFWLGVSLIPLGQVPNLWVCRELATLDRGLSISLKFYNPCRCDLFGFRSGAQWCNPGFHARSSAFHYIHERSVRVFRKSM